MKLSAVLFTTIAAVATSASAFTIPQGNGDFSLYRREAELLAELDVALIRRTVEGRRSRSASPPTADSPIRPNSATQIHNDAHGNVNLNIDPSKAPSHGHSVNGAHHDGTPMHHLPLATDEEHKEATRYMKNKPSAGHGKVKEDEPPRIAHVKNSERHIQPADRHESSKVQAGAVKEQKKEFLRQKAQGHNPTLSYSAVHPTDLHKVLDGRIEKKKGSSSTKPTSKTSSRSSSRHSSPGKRDEIVAGLNDAYMAGYRRAIEHLSVWDLEDF